MNSQAESNSAPTTNVSMQQLTKDLVEIFKLRAASLLRNTLVLSWPIIAAVIVYSIYPFVRGSGDYDTLVAIVYVVILAIFLFYSVPRIGLDRLEKRLWVKHYLTKREVMTDDESRAFIRDNKSRILSYKRYILTKVYLVPLIITFTPLVVAAGIVADGVMRGTGGALFAYAFLGLLAGVPLLLGAFLFYWLHTRTTLMFVWERFLDAVEDGENLSDAQILQDARRLSKVLGLRGRAKFMSYDFAVSAAIGLPTAAASQTARLLPKPVEQAIGTYALLYSFNAYQLENLAISRCFYMESRAKGTN